VKKTAAEIKALNACHAEQERLRDQRRAKQAANVARKRAGLLGTDKTDETSSLGNDMVARSEDDDREAEDEEWDNDNNDNGEAVEPSAPEGSISETDDEGSQRPER